MAQVKEIVGLHFNCTPKQLQEIKAVKQEIRAAGLLATHLHIYMTGLKVLYERSKNVNR